MKFEGVKAFLEADEAAILGYDLADNPFPVQDVCDRAFELRDQATAVAHEVQDRANGDDLLPGVRAQAEREAAGALATVRELRDLCVVLGTYTLSLELA